MSNDLRSVPALTSLVDGESAGSEKNKSLSASLLLPRISELLKVGGVAYVVGFGVIMVHTMRLNGPVVEAFQFQNIIAGLPVWVPLCIAIWLWPRLSGAIVPEDAGKPAISRTAKIILVVSVLLGSAIVYYELRAIVGRPFSVSENIVLISGIVFATFVSMLATSYREGHRNAGTARAVFWMLCVYSGIVFLVFEYAIFIYPKVPQGMGGGHPVQVRLYLKERGLSSVLGGEAAPGEQAAESGPVYLYYRTSAYLLVSKAPSQPLIQVPAEQVLAVVWLESRSR
jgi:hypothetical protein